MSPWVETPLFRRSMLLNVRNMFFFINFFSIMYPIFSLSKDFVKVERRFIQVKQVDIIKRSAVISYRNSEHLTMYNIATIFQA